MTNYILLGYNSSGYKSSIELSFDGKIEKLYKPDPSTPDTQETITYFHITHPNGTITDEDHDFMDKLILDQRGYHESFLVCQVFEINKDSLFKAIKANDVSAAKKLIEAGVDVNSKNKDGQTVLHIVAKMDDIFIFGQLLNVNADINAKDYKGNTPLNIHLKHKNDKHFIEYLLKEGATKKNRSFIKKILNLFQLSLLIIMPLTANPIINLDFSGLESLSKMGKSLNKLSPSPAQKTIIALNTEKEVLAFHNKYINKNPKIKHIISLIPQKPQIFIEENNIYEIIYSDKGEKLSFTYSINNNVSILSLYIIIEQSGIPVWTQENVFYANRLTPSRSREIFYDGTVRTLYYEYSEKNDKVNIRQNLDYDEAYKLQNSTLLCNEENQAIIDTKLPLSSYVQSSVITLEKTYRDSIFETTMTNQKLTLKEAYEHCDNLSIDGYSVWYLPRVKELLTLSTNDINNQENNTSIYIQKKYLKVLPQVKDINDLSFWTSNLAIENGYELGQIVSFAYSLDELENSSIDLASDKSTKHFVLCKKDEDTINIRWDDDKFLSIYGNNFRLSSNLTFIGSFDLDDKEPKTIDYKNSMAYFPLKNFLLINDDDKILYILNLNDKKEITKIKLPKNEKLYLKDIKQHLLSL